jgi:hypothetical protein
MDAESLSTSAIATGGLSLMGYQNSQQQPYYGGSGGGTNPLSAAGQRYGNYGGARFANSGVGNSNRLGTRFRPQDPAPNFSGMGSAGGNMSNPNMSGQFGQTALMSQPFGTQMAPGGWNGGYQGGVAPQNPLAGGSRPMSGGFGPVPPTSPQDDQNRMLQSMFASSQYAPQQTPSNYSFADQTEQYRRMYGF